MRGDGFFKVYYATREMWVWHSKYLFYYVDLLSRAEFVARWRPWGHSTVLVRRGELATTYRHLAGYWGKPLSWVKRFLDHLEKSKLVHLRRIPRSATCGTGNGTCSGTIITMLMFDGDKELQTRLGDACNASGNAHEYIVVRSKKEERTSMCQPTATPSVGGVPPSGETLPTPPAAEDASSPGGEESCGHREEFFRHYGKPNTEGRTGRNAIRSKLKGA